MFKIPGVGVGETGEGGQRVQTSSYKMSEFRRFNVQHGMVTMANNTVLYIRKLPRE